MLLRKQAQLVQDVAIRRHHIQAQVFLDIIQHLLHMAVGLLQQVFFGDAFCIVALAGGHADMPRGKHGHAVINIIVITAKEIVAQGVFQPFAAIMPLGGEIHLALRQIKIKQDGLLVRRYKGAQQLQCAAQLRVGSHFSRQEIMRYLIPQDIQHRGLVVYLVGHIGMQAIQQAADVNDLFLLRIQRALNLKDRQARAHIVQIQAQLAGLVRVQHVGNRVHALAFHQANCLVRVAGQHGIMKAHALPVGNLIEWFQHGWFIGGKQYSIHCKSSMQSTLPDHYT